MESDNAFKSIVLSCLSALMLLPKPVAEYWYIAIAPLVVAMSYMGREVRDLFGIIKK